MGRRTHSGNPSLRTNTGSSSSSSPDSPSRTLRSILTTKLARGVIESLVHVMVFESSCSPVDQTRSFEETMTRMIDRFDSKDVRVQRALSRLLKMLWVEQKRIDAALHSTSSTGASGSTSANRPPQDPVVPTRNRSNTHLPMSNRTRAADFGDRMATTTLTNPLIPPHRFIPLVNRGSISRSLSAVSFLDRTRPRSRPTVPLNGPTFSDFFSENDDDDDENRDEDGFGLREEMDPIDLISDPTGDHQTPVDTGLDTHHWGFAPEDDDGDEDEDEDEEEEDADRGWGHTGNADENDSEEDEEEDDDDDGEYLPSAHAAHSEPNGSATGETDEPPPFSRTRRFTDLLQPSAGLRTSLLRIGSPLGIRASSRDSRLRRLSSLNYIVGDEDENEEDGGNDDNAGGNVGVGDAVTTGQEAGNDPDRTINTRTRQTLSSRPNTFVRPRRAPPGPTAPLEEHHQYASYIRGMVTDDEPLAVSTTRDSFPSLSSSWTSIIQQLAPTLTIPPRLPPSSSSTQPSSNSQPASNADTETISPNTQADLPAQSASELTNGSEPRLGSEERNEFEDASAGRRARSRVGIENQVRS